MHGYEMMQELADRTKGIWRPSPGSLYPALQLLEDQGLVQSETADGRRQFTLTEKGRSELSDQPRKTAPWDTMVRGANQDDFALRVALRQVSIAVSQVAEAGTQDQKVRAEHLVLELRRQIYYCSLKPASRLKSRQIAHRIAKVSSEAFAASSTVDDAALFSFVLASSRASSSYLTRGKAGVMRIEPSGSMMRPS